MHLRPIPAFDDNYFWLLHDGREALVVDPGAAAPVLDALAQDGLQLAGILVTHHHGDHVGGLAGLLARHPVPVWGPANEVMPVPVQPVSIARPVKLLGLQFHVIEVPGHTAGHVAYYAEPAGEAPILFCGDTLFSAGCGRLFEGTPAQMLSSLAKLSALPGATRVCCAHEYTLSNLRFARAVEPDNADTAQYQAQCEAQRAAGLPTLPAELQRERLINPFLRWNAPAVIAAAHQHGAATDDPVAVFAAIRQWKNDYR
jgi:hydroxyacylglutathione hydrolase